ncbi:MAG: invasion associated locus B family protein [Siculibacillus sp.]
MTVTVAKFAEKAARGSTLAAMAVALTAGVFTPAPSSAQSAAPTDAWIKVCRSDEKQKKELCKTAYDLRSAGGQFLASIAIVEATGEARKIVEMIMPTGLLLQPGLKVQVDQNKGEDAKFGMCAPDGCVAQMVSNEAFVASMKKGSTLTITAYGQASNPVTFTVPLTSFASANEGKSLDAAALKKREEAIAAEVEQKQKSIEDQLREEQRKAQGK